MIGAAAIGSNGNLAIPPLNFQAVIGNHTCLEGLMRLFFGKDRDWDRAVIWQGSLGISCVHLSSNETRGHACTKYEYNTTNKMGGHDHGFSR